MFRAACLVICIMAATACAAPPPERPTLCQFAATREAYAGRTLTVEGYLLVSRDGSALTDPSCATGVGIAWRSEDDPRLRALNDVAHQMRTLEPWMVRVRVTGVVEQADGPLGPFWQLRLAAADVLSAKRLPDQDRERFQRWLQGPSPAPFRPSR